MKWKALWLILSYLMVAFLLLVSCTPTVTEDKEVTPEKEVTSPPQAQGETLIVNSTADAGPGTLRQALLEAQSGDTITFDPAVFPPAAPKPRQLDDRREQCRSNP